MHKVVILISVLLCGVNTEENTSYVESNDDGHDDEKNETFLNAYGGNNRNDSYSDQYLSKNDENNDTQTDSDSTFYLAPNPIERQLYETCYKEHEVVLLEGETVSISYFPIYNTNESSFWLRRCLTDATVKTEFNTSRIMGYRKLYLYDVKMPAVPESSILEEVQMTRVTPVGVFGGCSRLTSLVVDYPNVTLMSPEWLSNCTKLSYLNLSHLTFGQLQKILNSITHVNELALDFVSEMAHIVFTPLFPAARGVHQSIKTFKLYNYNVDRINPAIDKTNAVEMSEALMLQLSLLPCLEHLQIGAYTDFDFCAFNNITSLTLKTLKVLELFSTGTYQLCYKERRIMPMLTTLSLANSDILIFQFSELYSHPSPHLEIEHSAPSIELLLFTREDYFALAQGPVKGNITLNAPMEMDCDCKTTLWFAKAISEHLLSVPRIECHDGTPLGNETCDYIFCERIACESDCLCCVDEPGFLGDCRDAKLTSFPSELTNNTNIKTLLVPNNNFTTLPEFLPKTLTWLDLSGNDFLRTMSESNLKNLFEVSDRRMSLAGNLINCDCDTQSLIEELHKHNNQIEDYESLVCAENNTSIAKINVPSLCAERNRQTTRVTISVLVILAIVIILLESLYYFRYPIWMFLNKRRWDIFYIREKKADVKRLYDLFLSYCDDDEKIIKENLLPELDRDYSVCVHFRDWPPGRAIPTQITKSVEDSRRTVLVISRNSVKSIWELLAFRTAQNCDLIQGRNSIVIVALDDIFNYLEGDLKMYMQENKFLKLGEPWFRERLRFALPHRPLTLENSSHVQLGFVSTCDGKLCDRRAALN